MRMPSEADIRLQMQKEQEEQERQEALARQRRKALAKAAEEQRRLQLRHEGKKLRHRLSGKRLGLFKRCDSQLNLCEQASEQALYPRIERHV